MNKIKIGLRLFFFPLCFYPFSIHAYDQVQVDKVVPLVSKKIAPSILRMDKQRALWVLDQNNALIQEISLEGKVEATLKSGKKKENLFKSPVDFTFTEAGLLLVADPGLNRVALLSPAEFDPSKTKLEDLRWDKVVVRSEIHLENLSAVAVSRDDIVAVGNSKEKSVHLYSFDGVSLHTLFAPDKSTFDEISSLAFSRDGVLWVLDGSKGKLHRFSPERKWLGAADVGNAQSVVVDDFGFAYVSLREGRWKEVSKEGEVTGTFGTKGKQPGQLSKPSGLALEDSNFLWVADSGNNRLQLFKISNKQKESILLNAPAARIQVRKGGGWAGLFESGYINKGGEVV